MVLGAKYCHADRDGAICAQEGSFLDKILILNKLWLIQSLGNFLKFPKLKAVHTF